MNEWCDHTTNAWWTTNATSATNVALYAIQPQQGSPAPRSEGSLEWLRRQVSEITELAS